jgi:hypothetical protein
MVGAVGLAPSAFSLGATPFLLARQKKWGGKIPFYKEYKEDFYVK